MLRDDKFRTNFRYWRKFKPEEELYKRLQDNPVWPFKPIGDGYFYVSFRSDRVQYGIGALIMWVFALIIVLAIMGPFSLASALFTVSFILLAWTLYGKVSWRELVISRIGKGCYMERVFQNEEILFQSEIRNVYIRLLRKIDSMGDPYFCLLLGGFEIDDLRITRMTRADTPLRVMGMRIAYRVGINFFDWRDESEEHLIWHYKSYSKLTYTTQAEIIYQKDGHGSAESVVSTGAQKGTHQGLSVQNLSRIDESDKRKLRYSRIIASKKQ